RSRAGLLAELGARRWEPSYLLSPIFHLRSLRLRVVASDGWETNRRAWGAGERRTSGAALRKRGGRVIERQRNRWTTRAGTVQRFFDLSFHLRPRVGDRAQNVLARAGSSLGYGDCNAAIILRRGLANRQNNRAGLRRSGRGRRSGNCTCL